MSKPAGQDTPELPPEEDEAIGVPSFEMLVSDGQPVVSGSYFLHPPLRAVDARWDTDDPSRLRVRADDGSEWFATAVPASGRASVVLQPVDGEHPALTKAHAVVHLAGEVDAG